MVMSTPRPKRPAVSMLLPNGSAATCHVPSRRRHAQTPDHLKTQTAEEAFNKNGLSQRTIRLLKDAYPDLEVRPACRTATGRACVQARSRACVPLCWCVCMRTCARACRRACVCVLGRGRGLRPCSVLALSGSSGC